MRFSDEFIADVKSRNDINDTISSYVDLRDHGRYSMGLCPFHNEKTPSFAVYSGNQSYYCFGCGAGGDVVTFIMNIENLDYPEAVKLLAERSGLPLPQDGYDDGMARLRRRVLDANREAGKFFYNCLMSPSGKIGLDYFKRRKLSPETIRHFGLGFAPDNWDSLIKHMKSLGFTESELISADLARKTKNGNVIDVFRNRVMFPIIDLRGSVIAFGGRVLDDSKPKYVNTSDTLVYKKSQGVFALNFAKNGGGRSLILCEGYMDVIAYHQAGFTNAVAGLGTAFTSEQAKLLSKYADEIILSYDSDEAGQKATKRTIGILSGTPVRIKVVMLDGGKDPDEIIKTAGKEKMSELLREAVSGADFDLQKAAAKTDISTPEGKIEYLNNAVKVIAGFRDPISRDIYASKLAAETGVLKEAITAQIEKEAKKGFRKEQKQIFIKAESFGNDAFRTVNPQRQRYLRACVAEETVIASLLQNPDFYKKIKDQMSDELFVADINRRIYKLIAERLDEEKPVDIIFFGQDLTKEEMSYLAMLSSARNNMSNTVKECLDCIKVMKEEKEKRDSSSPENMSDEEFLASFRKKKDNM